MTELLGKFELAAGELKRSAKNTDEEPNQKMAEVHSWAWILAGYVSS